MRYLFTILLLFSIISAEFIEEYNVTVLVEQSGKLHLKEEILYNFNGEKKPRHGIKRWIPRKVKVDGIYLDPKITNYKIYIDGVATDFTKSKITIYDLLKIGDSKKEVFGKHLYTIKYDINSAILPSIFDKTKDMIFLNVIGNEWEVPINRVNVTLKLPKVLPKSSVQVIYPKKEESYKWVDNYTLKAYKFGLPPKFGLGLALEFKQGLLLQSGHKKQEIVKLKKQQEQTALDNYNKLLQEQQLKKQKIKEATNTFFGVLFALIALLIYYKREFLGYSGNKSIVTKYYPPKGISILQAGLLLDKYADKKDYAAAILELGALKKLLITKDDKDTILIRKNSNIDNLTKDQTELLDALFKDNDRYEVTNKLKSDIEYMQKALDKIDKNLYKQSIKDGFSIDNFKEYRSSIFWYVAGFVLLLLAVGVIVLFKEYRFASSGVDTTIATLAILIPSFLVAFIHKFSLKIKAFVVVVLMVVVGVVYYYGGFIRSDEVTIYDIFTNPLLFSGLIAILLIDVYQHIGRLSKKGLETKRHLLGLEEFIKRVKTDQIKHFLQEDKYYIEKMLPYAMLFGEIKHWLNFYDELNITKPAMSNGNIYVLTSLDSSFESSLNIQSSYISSGGYTGSSSYGGGGYSGGVGGGGGSSW